jgi:hypothetical protein
MSKLIKPSDAVKLLKCLGYLARQNQNKNSRLWINLGGPRSEIKRYDFKGLILLNPSQNSAMGVCPDKVNEFKSKVMENLGMLRDKRKEGIPGPKRERHRVEVTFDKGVMFCKHHAIKPIEGFPWALQYNNAYMEDDINAFLKKFNDYCLGGNFIIQPPQKL